MWILCILAIFSTVSAQIPSLGWCPDYQPMKDFNVNRFLGSWHEAERYFTVSELGSRCVTTTYEKMPDGRVWVTNEIKNSFTGTKRVLDGTLQTIGREGEAKLLITYNSLPISYDTEYFVLDTDYDSFAVVWSCSGVGPVHMQNAWILTRDRIASSLIMQRAYTVLERFKISRMFFIKTTQEDCSVFPEPISETDKKVETPAELEKVAEVVEKAAVEPAVEVDQPQRDQPEEKVEGKSDLVNEVPLKVPEVEVAPKEEPVGEKVAEPEVKSAIPVPEFIVAQSADKEKPQDQLAEQSEAKPSEEKAPEAPKL